MTAASPIHRGYLSDVDCRWGVMSNALDDRTPEERDVCSNNILINCSMLTSLIIIAF